MILSRAVWFCVGALSACVLMSALVPSAISHGRVSSSESPTPEFEARRTDVGPSATASSPSDLLAPGPPQLREQAAPSNPSKAAGPPRAAAAAVADQLTPRLPHIVRRVLAGAFSGDLLAKSADEAELNRMGAFLSGRTFSQQDHGVLTDYTMCSETGVPCTVHPERSSCLADGFCGWCGATEVCVDLHLAPSQRLLDLCGGQAPQAAPQHEPASASTTAASVLRTVRIGPGGALEDQEEGGGTENCTAGVVHGNFQYPAFLYEDMLWHWLQEESNWRIVLAAGNASLPQARSAITFIYEPNHKPTFAPYLGLVTNTCWRQTTSLPEGMCLQSTVHTPKRAVRLDVSVRGIPAALGLGAEPPQLVPHARPHVCLIQRTTKRFILNLPALVATILAINASAVVLQLELLTLHEQMSALRRCTILAGIHGSGLVNLLFLAPGAGVLEIVPYKTLSWTQPYYQRLAAENHMWHRSLEVLRAADAVFHWQRYKPEILTPAARADFMSMGCQSSGDFFTFWVNQDVRVDAGEFQDALKVLLAHVRTGPPQVKNATWSGPNRAQVAEDANQIARRRMGLQTELRVPRQRQRDRPPEEAGSLP